MESVETPTPEEFHARMSRHDWSAADAEDENMKLTQSLLHALSRRSAELSRIFWAWEGWYYLVSHGWKVPKPTLGMCSVQLDAFRNAALAERMVISAHATLRRRSEERDSALRKIDPVV